VNPSVAGAYNAAVTRNLANLNDAARERVRRRHRGAKVYVLAIVLEVKRGVFHCHVVLGYVTAADRAALDTWTGAYAELRQEHGFGRQWDSGKPGKFSGRAATYVAKYLSPESAKGSFVPALRWASQMAVRDPQTGRKPQLRPIFVSPVLTRRTGVTMRFLRFKRWVWRAWGEVDDATIRFAYLAYREFGAALVPLLVPEVERKPDPDPIPF
jgi:hypothetical protein